MIVLLIAGIVGIALGVKNILIYRNYMLGGRIKAIVQKYQWVGSERSKFKYLFPSQTVEITYVFTLGEKTYKKEERDINHIYKKYNLPKIGERITVYITKDKSPEKVTMNAPNKNIRFIWMIFVFGIICIWIYIAKT